MNRLFTSSKQAETDSPDPVQSSFLYSKNMPENVMLYNQLATEIVLFQRTELHFFKHEF